MRSPAAVWDLLTVPQRRKLIALQILSLLMAFSTLSGIAALMPFLMVLSDPHAVITTAALSWWYSALGFESARAFVAALGAAFVAIVLLSNALNLWGTLAMTRFAQQIGNRFHSVLLNEYLHCEYLFHTRHSSAELFDKVVYATNRVTTGLIEGGLILVTNAVVVVLIVVSTMFVNPLVAASAAVWLGGAYLLVYWGARRKLTSNGQVEAAYIAARTKTAQESLAAVKEIAVLGKQQFFRERFEQACEGISRLVVSNHAIAHTPRYALEGITFAGLVGIALFVSSGRDVSAWLSELSFLGFAAYRLMPAIQQLFAAVVRIRANTALFESVEPDLRRALARSAVATDPRTSELQWGRRPQRDIVLDNVTFQYDPSLGEVLKNVDMRIAAGSFVGVVGDNGSGKTTLVDVLLGLLQPGQGTLRVDGVQVEAGNRSDWQRCVAYVPQTISILDTTLSENIALGSECYEHDRMSEAIALAGLQSLVSSWPLGLEQKLGERGSRLSGGERQRVGIARALYRRATVMVLDEPTSSLDTLTEAEIVEVLSALRGRCTIVLVTHRLSTLRHADAVFTVEGGRVRRFSYPDVVLGAAIRRARRANEDAAAPTGQRRC